MGGEIPCSDSAALEDFLREQGGGAEKSLAGTVFVWTQTQTLAAVGGPILGIVVTPRAAAKPPTLSSFGVWS